MPVAMTKQFQFILQVQADVRGPGLLDGNSPPVQIGEKTVRYCHAALRRLGRISLQFQMLFELAKPALIKGLFG